VAVVAFDDQSRVIVPRTAKAEDVRRRLGALKTRGRFTALHDALYDASKYLRDAPGTRKAIVLLTDGRDENSALNLDDGLRLAQEAHIPVYAVGVGRMEARVLRRIAKLTGGEFLALGRVRGSTIASRIAAQEETAAPGGASVATARDGPAGPAAATPPAVPPTTAHPAPPSTAPAPAAETPSSLWLLAWIVGGLAVLAAVVVLLVGRSRAAAPPPVSSGDADAEPEPDLAMDGSFAADEHSPTVLARMNVTEEYLDKTVVLKEKHVLSVTRGPAAGQTVELSRTAATSIGRARANDLQIEDVSISSQHCRVRPENGNFVLHDLRSTNGTFVNEKRVARHVLHEGDIIKIGESQLVFKLDLTRA
jgi:hypothetical protein